MKIRKLLTVLGSAFVVALFSLLIQSVSEKPKINKHLSVTDSILAAPYKPLKVSNTAPDTIIVMEEADASRAIDRLETGELDLYADNISNPALAAKVKDSSQLDSYSSLGGYLELTFNPAGPVFEGTGKLNPFAVPRIREAMNQLIDRDYIAQQIYEGLAVPRWLPISTASADYANLADVARGLELEYAYDWAIALRIISAEMRKLGATLDNGRWQYDGEPVEIILLIRTEDKRRAIGDYIGDQLEMIGFTVIRDYKTAAEAGPIWISGDPAAGLFHIYTGGWVSTAIPRDQGGSLAFFYTDLGLSSPLWQAYAPNPEFYDLAQRLLNADYQTIEERTAMMSQALALAMEDSVRIFLVDTASITPRRKEVQVASGIYGGTIGSELWSYTIQRTGNVSATLPMNVALPRLLIYPWNPLGGSHWIFDSMLIRGTGENALLGDPFNGLVQTQRIEKAELFVEAGLPVRKTLNWIDLQFVPEIVVPDDAWVTWDAAMQRFLTAAEANPEPQTAQCKSVTYYPAELFDSVTWHDGSPFSIADVVLNMILTFDRAQESSPFYDPSVVGRYNAFMNNFKGIRIVSQEPLIIEHYSKECRLDAELNINTWWPYYQTGQSSWHAIALGLMAEAAGEAAFTPDKASANQVEWLNYIDGLSLDILYDKLIKAVNTNYIPYTPTLGNYITTNETVVRWDNLMAWHQQHGHFWLGTGPFYLDNVQAGSKILTLRRYAGHPDPIDKWDDYIEPPIAEVNLDGPESLEQGEEAIFNVNVTLNDQPYAIDDIDSVRYLVIDSRNRVRFNGDATIIEDGFWQVVLGADVTSRLPGGLNRLEISVSSKRIVIPSYATHLFELPYEIHMPLVQQP